MSSWYEGKLFVEHALDVSHDALHVILGVPVLLVVSLVSGRPVSSPLPWLVLLAFTLWNEAVDLWTERWPNPGMQFGEGAKDVALTMLLPTLLLTAARLRPDLFRSSASRRRRR